jgi:hypothetical protein
MKGECELVYHPARSRSRHRTFRIETAELGKGWCDQAA